MKFTTFILVITFSFSLFVSAQNRCVNLFQEPKSTAVVFDTLRREQRSTRMTVLAAQQDYMQFIDPDGAGACATVAVANLMQGLHFIDGGDRALNLNVMIHRAYDKMPVLLKGRVTNSEMLQLLADLNAELFGGRLTINTLYAIFDKTGFNRSKARRLPRFNLETLDSHPYEMKLLSYSMIDVDGTLLGRHFAVIKQFRNRQLVLVDPINPEKDFTYTLQPVLTRDGIASYKLTWPGQNPLKSFTRVIDSVMSVSF